MPSINTGIPDFLNENIVLVSRFPRDIDHPRGGVETATVSLAKALIKVGVKKLNVVTAEPKLSNIIIEDQAGIIIHRLPRSGWPMFADVFLGPTTKSLKKYIKNLNPCIVHFHETWGFGSSGYSLPTIFTVHGFDSLNLPTEKSNAWRMRKIIWHYAEKIGISNQNMLISIAPYVNDKIKKISDAPIVNIWNSLDESYFQIERKEQENTVLFLGWINPRKNARVLIEASRILKTKIKNLKVELCGEHSDQEYANELKMLIEKYNLTSVVTMPGRITQTEVREKLQSANILVLPSLQENAPMVIAEAMAIGTPVIASNLCGIPDMIEDGISGLLTDPKNPAKIAEQINALLENKELHTTLSRNAKKSAFEKFHPLTVGKSTLKAYESAVKNYQNIHLS